MERRIVVDWICSWTVTLDSDADTLSAEDTILSIAIQYFGQQWHLQTPIPPLLKELGTFGGELDQPADDQPLLLVSYSFENLPS
jgi:hypothetical protein